MPAFLSSVTSLPTLSGGNPVWAEIMLLLVAKSIILPVGVSCFAHVMWHMVLSKRSAGLALTCAFIFFRVSRHSW